MTQSLAIAKTIIWVVPLIIGSFILFEGLSFAISAIKGNDWIVTQAEFVGTDMPSGSFEMPRYGYQGYSGTIHVALKSKTSVKFQGPDGTESAAIHWSSFSSKSGFVTIAYNPSAPFKARLAGKSMNYAIISSAASGMLIIILACIGMRFTTRKYKAHKILRYQSTL